MGHTNGIESHWVLFKRGLDGIYHHVSVKHLDSYATEFAGHRNVRPMDTAEQIADIARGSDSQQPFTGLLYCPANNIPTGHQRGIK